MPMLKGCPTKHLNIEDPGAQKAPGFFYAQKKARAHRPGDTRQASREGTEFERHSE
jgi:hypothetical protein